MGTGNLIIQARTADNALPLVGVRVRIMDQEGTVLFNLTTDESGETEQISLYAVDRSLSLDPSYIGIPYSTYGLEAEAEGFNSLYIADVQIFDGENAIQHVALIPMLASQRIPLRHEIFIGRHALAMTEPRNQAGPLKEPTIFRHVIIPNPITVHLGTPDSYATNVQISFPDYIKNAASSEIYATWPQTSLEANIYAIITFALNRVFTQWYRSRGYNFDITNSTAYDQYFVYGRTIYESISRIVDKIFNQYIRRQGQIAPFFTAFCNGTTVTCPGLSQWGTVTLANQGLSTMQILRYYYPNDIEFSQTNIITGIIIAYPGTTLRLGSRGLAVQVIQTYLNRIRGNFPAIPLITDDPGVFGSSTQASVSTFQNVFSLTANGIVEQDTWNKISFIYVAVARLASLESEGTALGIGTIPPDSILRVGSSGVDVIILQYILSFISEFYPTIPGLTQDGILGSETVQAVIAFQQMKGLPANGIVAQSTWNALYDTYWGIKINVPIPEPGPGVIVYIVRPGDTLWSLAQRFNTTVDAIKALNNLTSDVLRIGQVLRIPSTVITYIVQPGDTLWSLAQRFNTTVEAIMTLNNLTSDRLMIGQTLLIRQ
ncbi:LysM peptidoglycan-binding domain-containing protein [Candidatus Clostridium radicumherbarum]|uniref:LysM peptidoglycan-binding domain-containing protein n=1 Tax=Candidatus Clostridium radicumherbarum TaxID=3381662 RepID=A0ABW8TTT4_9CLOT